jgi:hypothetical protein
MLESFWLRMIALGKGSYPTSRAELPAKVGKVANEAWAAEVVVSPIEGHSALYFREVLMVLPNQCT